MEIGRQIVLATLGVGLGWAQIPKPALTLRVLNEAGVRQADLDSARKVAQAIFQHSDVKLNWIECPPRAEGQTDASPCRRSLAPSEYWMKIVADKPVDTSDVMLGFTTMDWAAKVGVAGVYLPAATELARHWKARTADVIGAAIAHEAGHLLLGVKAHSRSGVMRSHWSREEFDQLRCAELDFDPWQTRQLQAEIDRRAGRTGQASADQ